MKAGASTVRKAVRARPVLRNQLTLTVDRLVPGMFVMALDCPWEDTPFLLQGFLIEDADQIITLRSLCHEVVIDPRRSAAGSLHNILDLYILPEEQVENPEQDEMGVKIRFVETGANANRPERNFSLTRIPADLANSFKKMRRGSALDEVWKKRQRRLAEQVEEFSQPSTPRFSRSQIRYAPVAEQPNASPAASSAKPSVKWEGRNRRDLRTAAIAQAEHEESRLQGFRDLIESLQPDFSGWLDQLGQRKRQASPKIKKPSLWARLKPAVRRPDDQRESSVPRFIELLIYRDRTTIAEEVTRARSAVVSAEEILSGLRADLELENVLNMDGLPAVADSLVESIKRNGDALIWISRVRLRDSVAYTHGIKVASYLLAFGRHLGFPAEQLAQLATIGLLMDIGKIDVDPHVLSKRDTLTAAEYEAAHSHVERGLERLESTMVLDPAVRDGIAQHHEWISGEGYPAGLAGDEIGIFGRMAAIVDAYAALTTDRPYAATRSSYDALQLIYGLADRQFHGPLVEQFVRAIGLYPVGSLVLLSSEEVAVVTAVDKIQRLEPRVLVLTGPDKNSLAKPWEVDLAKAPLDHMGKPLRILRSLPAGVHGIDFRNFYIS